MKLLCPSKNLFSYKIKHLLEKFLICHFVNINQKQFEKVVHKYEIVLIRFSHKLSYKKDTKIKYILSPTTGINHIDKKFFLRKDIKILTLQNEKIFLKDVAASTEFTITLILMSLRKIKNLLIKKNREKFIGKEIYQKKIGIIGLGRIGVKVAKILNAFGASIYGYDIRNTNDFKFIKKVKLNYILKNCEVISVNIPLNSKTINFMNSNKLNLLKKNTLLVNSSRGEVVDEGYLMSLVRKKVIYYATDVVINEHKLGLKKMKKYNKLENMIYSNHIAGLTEESILKTDLKILNKFKKIYEKN
jgi:D-3-phosphoglycerate dehydrogenase / 2-oxoglutarate reductase